MKGRRDRAHLMMGVRRQMRRSLGGLRKWRGRGSGRWAMLHWHGWNAKVLCLSSGAIQLVGLKRLVICGVNLWLKKSASISRSRMFRRTYKGIPRWLEIIGCASKVLMGNVLGLNKGAFLGSWFGCRNFFETCNKSIKVIISFDYDALIRHCGESFILDSLGQLRSNHMLNHISRTTPWYLIERDQLIYRSISKSPPLWKQNLSDSKHESSMKLLSIPPLRHQTNIQPRNSPWRFPPHSHTKHHEPILQPEHHM